jgi:hypothetical protein
VVQRDHHSVGRQVGRVTGAADVARAARARARATGAQHVLTADHDGVIVDDIVSEWAARHGQPYRLRLAGPAGGEWSRGSGGPQIEMDAADFCRALSGRAPADGLLATQVPF